MTFSKTFLAKCAAMGAVAILANPVSAMTCVDFNALDEEQQMQAVTDMAAAARDAVREEEPLSEAAEGSDGSVQVETEETVSGDKPNADLHAETITVIREECDKNPDFDMTTVNFEAPMEK